MTDIAGLLASAGLRVSDLEWHQVREEFMPETYEAEADIGMYQVFADDDSAAGAVFAEWAIDRAQFGTAPALRIDRLHSFDDAQAACQQHFTARILSALSSGDAS